MKILNFFTDFFNQKNEYIGLSSFESAEDEPKREIRKEKTVAPEKTTLTGLLKRV